jgi:hypothetical protein
MKKIILLSICLVNACFAFGQAGEAVYTLSDSDITVKSKFVDTFFIEQNVVLTPYALKKTETILASSPYGNFSLKLYKFNGYEDEPGVCNVVEVLKNGAKVLELKNSLGFENMSSHVETESGFYGLITLAANTYALIFTEYIYASSPSMASIVLIRNGQVKLVYNKPMYIKSISKQAGSFNMQLQANTVEYISPNTPANEAKLHTIWWDGATLRFQAYRSKFRLKFSAIPINSIFEANQRL